MIQAVWPIDGIVGFPDVGVKLRHLCQLPVGQLSWRDISDEVLDKKHPTM